MSMEATAPTTQRRSFVRGDAVQRVLAFGALIVLFVIFSALKPESFLQFDNLVGILLATAVNGVLALGVTFVIITGGIDLSVGTVMTLSAVMTGVFITFWGFPVPIGIIAGILTGTLMGLLNGVVIARMKVPPFIATLGMLNIARGLALVISGLKPIYFNDTPIFNQIAMGSALGTIVPAFSVPNVVLVLFIAAIIASLILTKTVLGRYTFALGSNEEATRLSGVNVNFWKIAIYALGGTFSGLAGVMIAERPAYPLGAARVANGDHGCDRDSGRLSRHTAAPPNCLINYRCGRKGDCLWRELCAFSGTAPSKGRVRFDGK
jgi:ribose transport system permease protein